MPASIRPVLDTLRAHHLVLRVRELLDRLADRRSSPTRRSSARKASTATRRSGTAAFTRVIRRTIAASTRSYYSLSTAHARSPTSSCVGGNIEPAIGRCCAVPATAASSRADSRCGSLPEPDRRPDRRPRGEPRARRSARSRASTHHDSTVPQSMSRVATPGDEAVQHDAGQHERRRGAAPDATAPAAGTSGTSQTTYCGEKHLRTRRGRDGGRPRRTTEVPPAPQVEPRDGEHATSERKRGERRERVRQPADDVLRARRLVAQRRGGSTPSRLSTRRSAPPRLSTSRPRFSCTQ